MVNLCVVEDLGLGALRSFLSHHQVAQTDLSYVAFRVPTREMKTIGLHSCQVQDLQKAIHSYSSKVEPPSLPETSLSL